MARFAYFADLAGQAFPLASVAHDGHTSTKAAHFSGLLPDGRRVQATRAVEIVPAYRASRHECGARCLNASGRSPCECACKGLNHGRGAFMCDQPDMLQGAR